MQIDLALFLRLSRSLEKTGGSRALTGEGESDVLRALDGLLLAMDERQELLRAQQSYSQEDVQVQVEAITEEPLVPPELPADATPAVAPEAQVEWTRTHDLLYEDVLWLFRIGDNEGALGSLGRLMDLAYSTDELQRFLQINESKLMGLYEKILGDFKQPFTVLSQGLGGRYFWRPEEVSRLLAEAQASGSVSVLLQNSSLPKLRSLSLLHRLNGERMVQFGDRSVTRVASH